MKCSKCGGEIKNLPEYIEETGAEVLCSVCAGTAHRRDDSGLVFDKLRSLRLVSELAGKIEIAA
jgi:hypothetical protein